MEIRPVSGPDDQEACFDIFLRSINDLHAKQGQPPTERSDTTWMPESVAHFAAVDPDGLVLAIDGGEPIAFGCAFRRERFWFLAYLFVLPGSQASGVGRAIFESLLPPASERSALNLATVVESKQPVSTMLYSSHGIVPRMPLYWLNELPGPDGLPELPDGLQPRALSLDEHQEGIDRLDRELLGYARPRDHRMWAGEATIARTYIGSDGSIVGYGYLGPDDFLCPVASKDEAITTGIIRDVLTGFPGEIPKVTIQMSGAAGRLLPSLLRAGMRSEEGAQFLYCSNGRVPPPAYLPYAGYLP
ncbi:MAG: GNAT family N-acetyltransferase [Actinomycetota bacterium]